MSEVREATEADYQQVQGGMPEVRQEGKVTVIDHSVYDSDRGVVRGHQEVGESGQAVLSVNGEPVRFEVAKLWKLHGQPCEGKSASLGGGKYPRKGGKSNV